MKKLRFVLAVAVFFGLYAGAPVPASSQPAPPVVLIGLFTCSRVTFSSGGPYTVEGPAGPVQVAGGTEITFTVAGASGIAVQGSGADGSGLAGGGGPFRLSPSVFGGGSTITVVSHAGADIYQQGNTFSGQIVITAGDGGLLHVANVVDAEEYVRSVVSSEMLDSWPAEALKAQAVAVRSYLAYRCKMAGCGYLGLPDFDNFRALTPECIPIWSNDQVYKGASPVKLNCSRATDLTKGMVLTYGGAPAAAYFHASAEGMTEDPAYVWGGSYPYLVPVSEDPYESAYALWNAEYTKSELTSLLRPFGLIGAPGDIRGCEPGASGRWFGMNVSCDSGTLWVKANDFRKALGTPLRSLLFSSYSLGGGRESTGVVNPAMEVSVTDGSSQAPIVAGGVSVLGGSGVPGSAPAGLCVLSGTSDEGEERSVFQGKGWGHGVGLSQCGARASALLGKDFASILGHYYPGTALELWW